MNYNIQSDKNRHGNGKWETSGVRLRWRRKFFVYFGRRKLLSPPPFPPFISLSVPLYYSNGNSTCVCHTQRSDHAYDLRCNNSRIEFTVGRRTKIEFENKQDENGAQRKQQATATDWLSDKDITLALCAAPPIYFIVADWCCTLSFGT